MPKHSYNEYVQMMQQELDKQKSSDLTAEDVQFYNDNKERFAHKTDASVEQYQEDIENVENARIEINKKISDIRKENLNKVKPADFNELEQKTLQTNELNNKMKQMEGPMQKRFNEVVADLQEFPSNKDKDFPTFDDYMELLSLTRNSSLYKAPQIEIDGNEPNSKYKLLNEISNYMWTSHGSKYISTKLDYENAVNNAYGHRDEKTGLNYANKEDFKKAKEDIERYNKCRAEIRKVYSAKPSELEGEYTNHMFKTMHGYEKETLSIGKAVEAIEKKEKDIERLGELYKPMIKFNEIEKQLDVTAFPTDVKNGLLNKYADAKNAYDKLGWWDKNVWGKILPGKWSKASDIVNKKEAYEKVLTNKGFEVADLNSKADEIIAKKAQKALNDFTVIEKDNKTGEIKEVGTVEEIREKVNGQEAKNLGDITNLDGNNKDKSQVVGNNQPALVNNKIMGGPNADK